MHILETKWFCSNVLSAEETMCIMHEVRPDKLLIGFKEEKRSKSAKTLKGEFQNGNVLMTLGSILVSSVTGTACH